VLPAHLRALGEETVFARLSALAAATGAVNLGQGFPDTDGPAALAQAAAAAVLSGAGNQYPPGPGVPALRQAVADHQARCYGLDLDPDTEVLITVGATEAVAAAVLGLVDAGEEVIALEPTYDSYPAAVAFAGARLVRVALQAPGFTLDPDALAAAVTPATRLLLINSPHNPTGAMLDGAAAAALAKVAVDHDLVVVTDEVYEHLVYDGRRHVPLATLPGMAARTLTVSSAGKTFGYTGWKVGWVSGPAELVAAVRAVKQYLTYVASGPFQHAVATGLAGPGACYHALAPTLQDRRDQLAAGLGALGLDVLPCAATYFLLTDVTGLGYTSGAQFCDAALAAGVVAIPASVFYADPAGGRSLVRWAFCKQPDVLDEALHRLQALPR